MENPNRTCYVRQTDMWGLWTPRYWYPTRNNNEGKKLVGDDNPAGESDTHWGVFKVKFDKQHFRILENAKVGDL